MLPAVPINHYFGSRNQRKLAPKSDCIVPCEGAMFMHACIQAQPGSEQIVKTIFIYQNQHSRFRDKKWFVESKGTLYASLSFRNMGGGGENLALIAFFIIKYKSQKLFPF